MPGRSNKDYAFVFTFLLFVISGIIFGDLTKTGRLQYTKIKPEFRSQAQRSKTRSWRIVSWKEEHRIAIDGNVLKDPYSLRLDGEGNPYVMDLGDSSIKKFSPAGKALASFGVEPIMASQPPTLTDFAITRQGSLWICDPRSQKFYIFDSSGHLKEIRQAPAEPYRLVLDSRDQIWILSLNSDMSPLFLQRPNQQAHIRFGRIIKNQKANKLALDGWITSDGLGGLIYAPLYAGSLIFFSPDGELRFAINTIEPRAYAEIVTNTSGAKWIDRRSPVVTLGLYLVGSEIYSLTQAEVGEAKKKVLDVYSASDGVYRYSMEPPEDCQTFAANPESIYTLGRAGLTRWSMTKTTARK